ncbi:MAG: class I SAM-dependent methyltransferase [Actinomycetota bacterium]|jgi:2-polyprenyl-3-methyl-5-hydroxy-6-metoxy-1,4-benzoquinol methylase|nr:class I SAM-dependent methyltransferase [Actinomycetota bacterium]
MDPEATESNAESSGVRVEDYSHLSSRGQALVGTFREKVLDRIESRQPARLLEVGCGQGWLLASIAEVLPDTQLVGIDVREETIEFARSLVPSAQLIVANGERLPFADGEFDLVVCSEVLEHVDEPRQVLAEIDRVGRGRAVLSVPHEPLFWGANLLRGKYLSSFGNCPGHIHHWSRRGFRLMLAKRYPTVEVETSFPWLIAEVWSEQAATQV